MTLMEARRRRPETFLTLTALSSRRKETSLTLKTGLGAAS